MTRLYEINFRNTEISELMIKSLYGLAAAGSNPGTIIIHEDDIDYIRQYFNPEDDGYIEVLPNNHMIMYARENGYRLRAIISTNTPTHDIYTVQVETVGVDGLWQAINLPETIEVIPSTRPEYVAYMAATNQNMTEFASGWRVLVWAGTDTHVDPILIRYADNS